MVSIKCDNNINQIAKATNITGVIYKKDIDYMKEKQKNYQKKYGIYIPCFLINQKKVKVISMVITKKNTLMQEDSLNKEQFSDLVQYRKN